MLTYVANSIRANANGKPRLIPYSLVTALSSAPAPVEPDGITLNQWAARELGAKVGEAVKALCARFPVYGPAMRASYGFSPAALGEDRREGQRA